VFILRSSEHIDSDPAAAQLAGQIANVDIHATRVFATEGRKRTRVVRDHGYVHGWIIPQPRFLAKE
jgi:hypothetical protein